MLKSSVKILISIQVLHFCAVSLFYIHSLYRLDRIKKWCGPDAKTVPYKPRLKREAAGAPLASDDFSQWTVLLGSDTIIPKNVFERSCHRVHEYCSEKGKKLRGFHGKPGHVGPMGPQGLPGRRGSQGMTGPPGLVGDIGEEGPPGRNGRCNCSFPDLYVQRIAVPGPPVIKIEEKVIPVPVVVVKEVEVTKLVPFEPTPPGFLPPRGWSPGMPMPHPDYTRKAIKTTVGPKGPPRWSAGMRRQTTTTPYTGPPKKMDIGQSDLIDEILRNANETQFFNETLESNTTTEAPYTGPPTLGPNTKECRLNAVGIPVLHAESQYREIGSWMRDAAPIDTAASHRRWLTDDFASPVLYEYENERQLLNKKQKIKYYVDYLASGTGSMIYKGSYYYHRHGSNFLIRYNLETTIQVQSDELEIAFEDCPRKHDQSFKNCNETERDPWLYNRPHNYVDYAVDENGLWLIYTKPGNDHLFVSKIEPDFYVVDSWELEVNATELADAFIMCGVVYGLESATDQHSYISFAYDLYRNESIAVDIPWYNPYRGLTMLHYNPIDSRLYFFDNGKLLSVNVRIEEEVFEQESLFEDYYDVK